MTASWESAFPAPDPGLGPGARSEPPSLAVVLKAARDRLAQAGMADPGRYARRLAAEILDLDGTRLITEGGSPLSAEQASAVIGAAERFAAGEPLSRITGRRAFWTLDLALSPETLDPRPDSEALVEAALARIPVDHPVRVADMGTGSGCLLLAVLAERPLAVGIGVDISEGAVRQARRNAIAAGLNARCGFVVGDWAAAISGPIDVVLSNPPYIETASLAGLDPEVRCYDPLRALDGGVDGLEGYRRLAPEIVDILVDGGVFAVEIGFGQAFAVCDIFAGAGLLPIGIRTDLAGIQRVVIAKKCWNSELSTVGCLTS